MRADMSNNAMYEVPALDMPAAKAQEAMTEVQATPPEVTFWEELWSNPMDFIEWVNTLSPSAAQFWGAVVGVGGGLTAILMGALFNAFLNRLRDDRLRELEGRAVAAAIRSELATMNLSIADLLPIWEEGEDLFSALRKQQAGIPGGVGAPIDATEYAKLPSYQATIFEAYASRLGLLGSDLAGIVTVVYTNYRVRGEIFKQPIEMMAKDLPEHFARQIEWGKKFCKDCGDIERFLIEFKNTGKSASLAAEKRLKQQDERKSSQ